MSVDIFISHASEDKDAVARPLARALQELGIGVWLDEFELRLGDSLRQSIDRGLSEARFGVVILSPSFFNKAWPQKELDALIARESHGAVVLPVWHQVDADQVRAFSPILANRLAVATDRGIDEVAQKIAEAVIIKKERDTENFASRIESSRHGRPVGEQKGTARARGSSMSKDDKDEVFIVHGHDALARESVSRFVEKIGARPIVLGEQANRGRTIIEKLDAHSDVLFVVVLLTPDDIAAAVSSTESIRFRARQNVIFELGYFLGKLGRGRFCILYKGGVEIPSDLQGVAYIEMDSANGWRLDLARELRQAGVRIDLNGVLE